MHPDQLAALVAVVETGSFEGAARALHVTPSAVSQRIKALERHWGRVLVVRATPCRATPEGATLLRLARQVDELRADAAEQLDPDDGGRRRLAVVVNADSLATWFGGVLAEAATWDDSTLELFIEIEDHGTAHLRTGEAVAAITSDPAPVPGCTVMPLGVMRYLPVCTPALRSRWSAADGSIDWAALPLVRFSAADDLQHRFLRGLGPAGPRQVEVEHLVPSSQAFAAAVRAGLGWGLLPEQQLGDGLRTGELVRLPGAGGDTDYVDVHLAWQSWRLGSRRTARLTEAVQRAARRALRS